MKQRKGFKMNSLQSVRFPFIGLRGDGEPFEYLLEDVNQERAHISISRWMVNHFVNLNLQEQIHLFIPSVLTRIYQFRYYTSGIVSFIKKEEEEQISYYEICFNQQASIPFSADSPKELAETLLTESSLIDLLRNLIKDSLILKEGVLVYLKHLSPYFSRIVDYSLEEYQTLQNFIFDDLNNKIKKNVEDLRLLYANLKEAKRIDDIPIFLNLEYLRENIESEISLDLFLVAFANVNSQEDFMNLLKAIEDSYQARFRYSYMNYLISIKELEKRLYSNYNEIVLIYLKSI